MTKAELAARHREWPGLQALLRDNPLPDSTEVQFFRVSAVEGVSHQDDGQEVIYVEASGISILYSGRQRAQERAGFSDKLK